MNARQIAVIVLLGALALASRLLLTGPTPREAPALPPGEAGYYVVDGTLRGMAANGEALFEISADRVQQQPLLARVALDGVDVTYVDRQAVPWRLQAAGGFISADWQLLELQGDVRVEALDEAGGAIALTTERLTVLVDARQATTRSPVRVEGGGGHITAEGMTADLASETFRLESQVRGHFDAPGGAAASPPRLPEGGR